MTWLNSSPKLYVRQAFAKYLQCGIFAHGFARARCADCGHDFFVAFSCKGRGVCPSCNTRRMVETAAHLTDHVFPRLCVVDGVFEALAGGADAGADTDPQAAADAQSSPSKVIFHPASAIDSAAVAKVQATLRRRILRAFVGRGLLESFEAKDMLGYRHSGFSVDTSVRIAAHDRAGLERLLRYCARPAFSMERLRKAGKDLVYRCTKPHSEPASEKRGVKVDELILTPLELINRIAALVPPPRTHRHRYYGALAANSPLRTAVTALAQATPSQLVKVPAEPATAGDSVPTQSEPAPFRRSADHYLWAVLIARIYEVFPLLCPLCAGQMRIQ